MHARTSQFFIVVFFGLHDASTRKEYSRPALPLLIVSCVSIPDVPVESQDQGAAADHVKLQILALVLCRHLQVPQYCGTTPSASLKA
ncbi:hypothetical protein BDP55DRAFT_684461 [Colletotrichum godetiae]|uniref:Uncharacterized protein n=1 Tax=Colletotrichum godetiae TaxID=1209918 RepID=A0AAJ0ENP9_9PEZI|nr:uncharacterized protein BDP55DRAFT_684461 [Colletotrichum godetiae]KAK1657812.1 hypothetical protein BDP55DRAFT_684461 [Colletotrichum godetiae]